MQDTYTTNGPGLVFWVICIGFFFIQIAAMWKTFEKAGKPGWASIIPIYNGIVMLQIAGRPVWADLPADHLLSDSGVGRCTVSGSADGASDVS